MFPYFNGKPFPFFNRLPNGEYYQPDHVFHQGRFFSRKSGLMRSSTWIERGADGRPYYVKRKSAILSLRRRFAEAIDEIRPRNQSLAAPTDYNSPRKQPPQQAQNVLGVSQLQFIDGRNTTQTKSSSKHPLQAQQEMTESNGASAWSDNTAQQPYLPTFQQPYFVNAYPALHYHQPQLSPNLDVNVQGQVQTAMMPTRIPTPHPSMHPFAPPDPQSLSMPYHIQNQTGNNTTLGLGRIPPFHGTAPGYAQLPHITTAGFQILTPRDMSYTCNMCGRLRSSKYQQRHRLSPRLLSGSAMCRRCRKNCSKDEDQHADKRQERGYRTRNKSRNQSRSRNCGSQNRPGTNSTTNDRRELETDYYASYDPEETSSESEKSISSEESRSRGRMRRAASSSVQVIHYIGRPRVSQRSRSRPRRIVFVQDLCEANHGDTGREEVEVHYLRRASRSRGRIRSREPGTLEPVTIISRNSYRELDAPRVTEIDAYHNEIPLYARARSTSRLAPRQTRGTQRRPSSSGWNYPSAGYETGGEEYLYDLAIHQRPRDTIRRPVDRTRSHSNVIEGAERFGRDCFPTAPSPPPARGRRSSQPRQVEAGPDARTSHGEVNEPPSRSSSRTRPCRLQSMDGNDALDQWPPPPDDYDMYDRHGMRVRVREI